jgi:pre-mRNA-processing factor 39
MFEEINNNFTKASEVLEAMEHTHPELTSVKLRRANLERRRGDDAKATHLFEACVESTQEEALNADCAIKFARYLRLHRQDSDKAKEVLSKAIELHSDNIKLHLQMLDLLLHNTPVDCKEIVEFLDKAQLSDFKASQKLLLSQRKLEFLEDFGTDVEQLKKAQEDHVKLAKELKSKILEEEGSGELAQATINTKPPSGHGAGPKHPAKVGNSYPPVANTPHYNASHNTAYQNNAGRYGTYPQGNYPMQYGQGYTGY